MYFHSPVLPRFFKKCPIPEMTDFSMNACCYTVYWEKSSKILTKLMHFTVWNFYEPLQIECEKAKLFFFDLQICKEDFNLHNQCNKKLGRWCYHQKTAKLRVKHNTSFLGVPPYRCLGCQMKRKIMRNLTFFSFCFTFQSKLNKMKNSTPKLTYLRHFSLFLAVFWHFFNYEFKVEQKFPNFVFFVIFRFFWHPNCPQGCTPIGLNKIIIKSPSV